MIRGLLAALAATVAISIAGAAELEAQGGTISGMVIDVEGEQGAGVSVAALLNGIKTPLGTTGQDGRTVIDTERTDIATGTPVSVYSTGCDGARDVLLVPRGEMVPADEACPRPVGFFNWGEVSTLTFGIGPTGWALSTTARPRLDVGVSVHGALFNQFEDQACAPVGISACSADEFTTGFGAWAEYSLGHRYPFVVGVAGHYAGHDLSQTVDLGGQSIMRTGSVNGLFIDSYLGWRLRPRPGLIITPRAGPTWARNELSYDDGLSGLIDSRSDSGLKFNSGVDADWAVLPRLNIRLGYTFSHSFDGNDADLNHRVHGGLSTTLIP